MMDDNSIIEEVPIAKDSVTRLIPWIVALLVFLLCLILSGASSLGVSIHKWQTSMSQRVTVEIPLQHELDRDRITSSVVAYLKTNPAIASLKVADKQKLYSLFGVNAPNKHTADSYQDLPLPVIIDLTLHPESKANTQEMVAQLQNYTPGVRFETYTQWYDMLHLLQKSMQMVTYTFIMLIIFAVVIVITLVTKSGLLAHQESINILRLIGASNSYVAKKFQTNAFYLSSRGALIGFALAIPVTWILNSALGYFGGGEVLELQYDLYVLLMLPIVPLFVVLLSVCVSRFAVLKTLSSV